MMSVKIGQKFVGSCGLIGMVLCCVAPASAQVLLRDPLDDSTGANLTVLGTDVGNSTVVPGFNYGTGLVGQGDPTNCPTGCPAGIPEAPHSNVAGGDVARTGLFLAANVANEIANEVVAYINDPTNGQPFNVAGNYTAQVDVWMNYDLQGGATTQNGGIFLGGDGTSIRPDGPGFNYTGDGGFAGDYIMFKGGTAGNWAGRILSDAEDVEAHQYDQALFDARPPGVTDRVNEHDNPLIANAFCSIDCSLNPNGFSTYDIGMALDPDDAQGAGQFGPITNGFGGFRWMTITMDVEPNTVGPAGVTNTPGFAHVSLTTYQEPNNPLTVKIGVIDNSTGGPVVDMTGSVLLTYADYFDSLNTSGFQFGVFDNLIITQNAAPGVLGDYNNNGTVDAADYVLWRDGGPLQNEVEDPGTVSPADYVAWRARFGNPSGSGSASAAIPEPGTMVMAIVGLLGIGMVGVRRET